MVPTILLFFILCSRWIVAGYFPLSNLYESLLFLTWTLLTVYLYTQLKTKSKIIGAVLIPVALFINGFANLTLSPDMQKSSPLVPALQSNWLMMHVTTMMISYSMLLIGSLLSLFYFVFSFSQKKRENSTQASLKIALKTGEKKAVLSQDTSIFFYKPLIFGVTESLELAFLV